MGYKSANVRFQKNVCTFLNFEAKNVMHIKIVHHVASVIKCHKIMPSNDILWHMPHDKKCHKVCQYGHQKNRLDQTK